MLAVDRDREREVMRFVAEGKSNAEIADALEGRVATGTRRSEDLDENLLYVAVPVASGGEPRLDQASGLRIRGAHRLVVDVRRGAGGL